jgi:cyclopropane fatty-acyl-phospholipid synthase-like methyltransferase
MTTHLSPRLAAIVAALPIEPHLRVLEIGCGPGAVARVVADQLSTGHFLAIDRSSAAIDQLQASSKDQITSGRLSARRVAVEDFVLADDEEPFDLVFAVRVGALDGRHPEAGKAALRRIAAATHPHARLFVDGGRPLRELPIRTLS